MTITVGTDTYITLADARAYCANYSSTSLPTVDADAEALLKKSTLALDRIYGNRYLGRKTTAEQPLYWPRTYAYNAMRNYDDGFYITDSDGNPADLSKFPKQLGYAQVELALLMQAGVNVYEQPKPVVQSEKKKADVLEKELKYAGTGGQDGYKVQPLYNVELILRPLLTNTNNLSMVRGA